MRKPDFCICETKDADQLVYLFVVTYTTCTIAVVVPCVGPKK